MRIESALRAIVFFTLSFAAFVEVLLEYPMQPSTYLWISAIALGPIAAYAIHRGSPRALGGMLVVAAIIAALRLGVWSPRKPIVEDLRRVEQGMTAAQVEAIMAPYRARSNVSDGGRRMIYRHSDDGRYNADLAIIELEDGRVVRTEFSPD